jgi:hypothetical protein
MRRSHLQGENNLMPLVENDLKHLTAAQGYVMLGMWLDANAELEEIDAEVRHVPEVLVVLTTTTIWARSLRAKFRDRFAV